MTDPYKDKYLHWYYVHASVDGRDANIDFGATERNITSVDLDEIKQEFKDQLDVETVIIKNIIYLGCMKYDEFYNN